MERQSRRTTEMTGYSYGTVSGNNLTVQSGEWWVRGMIQSNFRKPDGSVGAGFHKNENDNELYDQKLPMEQWDYRAYLNEYYYFAPGNT